MDVKSVYINTVDTTDLKIICEFFVSNGIEIYADPKNVAYLKRNKISCVDVSKHPDFSPTSIQHFFDVNDITLAIVSSPNKLSNMVDSPSTTIDGLFDRIQMLNIPLLSELSTMVKVTTLYKPSQYEHFIQTYPIQDSISCIKYIQSLNAALEQYHNKISTYLYFR